MAPETYELLAESERSYLVAAAGCGKTQEIARAVAASDSGRQLVLTHTHAGVNSLRKRLKTLKVPESKYHVDTIAGWALRYAASFPALSGLTDATPTGNAWNAVYLAATELLQRSAVKRVVEASYSGLYVDEYQDCTLSQHNLILRLADVLPCRILGDPLQGIFGFQNDPLVNWDKDIAPSFQRLPDLAIPWRWRNGNQQLGGWLAGVRQSLLTGQPVDFQTKVISWRPLSPQSQQAACLNLARPNSGSVVAIHKWPAACHSFAGKLQGAYTSMEEIECKDLLKWSKAIEERGGPPRAAAIIEFASECMTEIGSELRPAHDQFSQGKMPDPARYKKHLDLLHALIDVASQESLAPTLLALRRISGINGATLFRRELWQEMSRAIQVYLDGKFESLFEAAWHVRNRTRQFGRQPEYRTVSRTLLVKGLEFDHVVVLDARELDRKNLYVALTRGKLSLTVLSDSPTICPVR